MSLVRTFPNLATWPIELLLLYPVSNCTAGKLTFEHRRKAILNSNSCQTPFSNSSYFFLRQTAAAGVRILPSSNLVGHCGVNTSLLRTFIIMTSRMGQLGSQIFEMTKVTVVRICLRYGAIDKFSATLRGY